MNVVFIFPKIAHQFVESSKFVLLSTMYWWGKRGTVGTAIMGYIGMHRCEGYGFQAVYCGRGYINQRVWVYM